MPRDGDVFGHFRRRHATARLHHPHVDAGILAEPRGDSAAGRTRTDDDVIELGHLRLLYRLRLPLIEVRLKRQAVVNRSHVDDLAVLYLKMVGADDLPVGIVRIGDRHAVRVLRLAAPDDDGGVAVNDDVLRVHPKHPVVRW